MTDFFLFIPGYVPEQITVVKDKILNFRRIHCRKDVVYTKIVNSKIQSCKCGTKVQEFSAEEAACPAFSAVGTPLGSTWFDMVRHGSTRAHQPRAHQPRAHQPRAHHKSLRKVQEFKCSNVREFKRSKFKNS